jgi:hypothetical protein
MLRTRLLGWQNRRLRSIEVSGGAPTHSKELWV